jgi:hypothetical protein
VTAIGDGEDNPPLERPSYPGFSDSDEETKPDIRSPLPQCTTLSPEDADRLMVRKALEASASATEALTALLPTLATKDDIAALHERLDELTRRVGGLDAGVGAMGDELAKQDRDLKQGFADVRTMLLDGIAKDVGFLRTHMDSVIPMANDAKQAMHRLEKVTKSTFTHLVHGPGAETESDEQHATAEAGQ